MIWGETMPKVNEELFIDTLHVGIEATAAFLIEQADCGSQIAIVGECIAWKPTMNNADHFKFTHPTDKIRDYEQITYYVITTNGSEYAIRYDLTPYGDVLIATLTALWDVNADEASDGEVWNEDVCDWVPAPSYE